MSPTTASKPARPSSSAAASDALTAVQQPQHQLRYALAIHGGAGVINTSNSLWIGSAMEGLQAALDAGHAVLRAGGSAVDAAVASVVVMENDPHFNAGVGSVLTASGHHELEASLMSSSGNACGAVALIKRVANPIVLARHVMERTPHIFLSGPEAELFAVQQGMQLVDNASLTTQQRQEQWQRYAAEQRLPPADEIVQKIGPADAAAAAEAATGAVAPAADSSEQHCQTVGAVAIDSQGRLAAATSTGGRTNKWDGRIGDTPMIGAGELSRGVAATATVGRPCALRVVEQNRRICMLA
ncbi:nucleophile aminohydrolase [Scenedesmus sp. NREL 46B-D3]|nr:nucleophile aminohydrolase [Scenedesmus sp. NREL 46B-D3]